MHYQTPFKSISFLFMLAGIALYAYFGGFFAQEIAAEIIILAILSISLDLIAGYGGMVSLAQGAIFGLSAYGFAAATVIFGLPAWLAVLIAIGLSALFGLIMGAVISATTGIYFIMASFAFGQMVYVLIFNQSWLGGDDGMSGINRFDLSFIGVNLFDGFAFVILGLVMLTIAYVFCALLLRASFGRTLTAIHINPSRTTALGVSPWRHKAVAFGFSAMVAAMAGILAAQHTGFISPERLHWTVSGEILIVVILGGIGTLNGALLGAILLVLLKHKVGELTDYWHLVIGVILILSVMAGGRGVYGQLEYWLQRRRQSQITPLDEPIAERSHA